MKNSKARSTWAAICFGAAMMMSQHTPGQAPAERWEALSPGNVPKNGTFFGVQDSAPYPYLPHPEWELPLYCVTTSNSTFYVFDDRVVNYPAYRALMSALTPLGADEGGKGKLAEAAVPGAYGYAAGVLWIELLGLNNQYDYATLGLHNVPMGSYGQILSRTNLEDQVWKLGPVWRNYDGTNLLVFDYVPRYGLERQFYRGVEGFPRVAIESDRYFYEPVEPDSPTSQGQVGIFNVRLSDALSTNLTVYYQISGSASNGADYTNFSGTISIEAGQFLARIFVQPRYDTLVEFDESVTLSLILTNGYVVDPGRASATLWIQDNLTNVFQTVVTNLHNPVGIDCHQPSNSLVLSINWEDGQPNNFVRVYTNGGTTVVSNWSGIAGEPDEVKLATARQTLNGFTNGDLYFGSVDKIGWLSADGTRSNLTWCVLTNEFVTNAQPLRGGLYVDQSGTFSNHLIAVTSGGADYGSGRPRGVWRVNGQGQPALIAEIATPHLEGVITLTNDVGKWGPLAGKVISGDESTRTIYAIDPNGVVTSFDLGIHPEDFDIIPPAQDLYCVNTHPYESSSILKLSRSVLANYVGDLLITQAGEAGFGDGPAVFIVSWNGSHFAVRRIPLPLEFGGTFEHVTFAPLNLPALNP